MRIIISFLAFIFFIGCINKNKIPENILSQDQMRMVMWDLMRTDEFITNFILKDSTLNRKAESIKLYEQVFQLHGTNQERFKQSLSFYQSRPDLLKPITDSLRSNERNALENQYNTPKQSIDSIKKKARSAAIKVEKGK